MLNILIKREMYGKVILIYNLFIKIYVVMKCFKTNTNVILLGESIIIYNL